MIETESLVTERHQLVELTVQSRLSDLNNKNNTLPSQLINELGAVVLFLAKEITR